MKLNTVLLLILIPLISLSQTYYKTIKPEKKWELREHIGMGVTNYSNYITSCDTTINSYSYYQLYYIFNFGQTPSYYLQGFVREDTIAQKVYFLDINTVNEELIVDYTLTVGDSFTYYGFPQIVVHIDTIGMLSSARKVIHFSGYGSGNPYLQFIEGVGNGFWGVAKNHNGGGTPEPYLVIEDYPLSCSTILPIQNISEEEAGIQVYPNPFVQSIHIELDYNKGIKDSTGNIYDLAGKIVSTFDIQQQKEISLEHLASGVYFLKIIGFKPIKLIKKNNL